MVISFLANFSYSEGNTMAKSTKYLILKEFTELLKEYDLDKITVTLLVNECKISRQTFYYHFSDIEDLINWSVKTTYDNFITYAKTASDVKEATVYFLTIFTENRFFVEKYFNSSYFYYTVKLLRNSIMEYIVSFYSKFVKTVKFSAEDTKFIIEFIADAVTGMLVTTIANGEEIDIEEFSDKINRTIFSKLIF